MGRLEKLILEFAAKGFEQAWTMTIDPFLTR